MGRYVALLRGINVGGRNTIRMADLRACFERDGFADVMSYIQSGNVLFSAGGSAAALDERIETMLAAEFGYDASVVLRSLRRMRATVEQAPRGFGRDPATYRSDVIFLKGPLTATTALAEVSTREGVDRAWTGPGVLYFERLTARASQSRLSKIAASSIYPRITVRNWNTTTTLLRLMESSLRR